MNSTQTLPDPVKARAYFEDKLAFTTGPVELDRERRENHVVIVDLRAAEDYAKGHIPGALSLPEEKWENPEGLDRNTVNVIYCYSQACHLAANAGAAWAAMGYPIRELEGGFKDWEDHGLEVERPAKPSNRKAVPATTRSPKQENL